MILYINKIHITEHKQIKPVASDARVSLLLFLRFGYGIFMKLEEQNPFYRIIVSIIDLFGGISEWLGKIGDFPWLPIIIIINTHFVSSKIDQRITLQYYLSIHSFILYVLSEIGL